MELKPHIDENGNPGVKATICDENGVINLFYKEHDAIKLAQALVTTVKAARQEATRRKQ